MKSINHWERPKHQPEAPSLFEEDSNRLEDLLVDGSAEVGLEDLERNKGFVI